jgi:hypothetical protein
MTSLSEQINDIQIQRKTNAKRKFRKSRLDKHRADLIELKNIGGSWQDLTDWLLKYKRVKITKSAVRHAFKRWPETKYFEEK